MGRNKRKRLRSQGEGGKEMPTGAGGGRELGPPSSCASPLPAQPARSAPSLAPGPATFRQKPLQRTNCRLVSEMGPRGKRQIACLVHNKPGEESSAKEATGCRGAEAAPART